MEITRTEMLEKKQDLIIVYYDKLKDLKIQRKILNQSIKQLEEKFSELIKVRDIKQLTLFDFPEIKKTE